MGMYTRKEDLNRGTCGEKEFVLGLDLEILLQKRCGEVWEDWTVTVHVDVFCSTSVRSL